MNIREIAELAGVSRAAVSRYFNDGYLSDEKKEAIKRVVEETGYKPLLQAQTLRTKKTKMIGIIMPKLASSALGHVINGILSVLNDSGYKCILADTQNEVEKELEYLKSFDQNQVDGVIFIATIDTPKHHELIKKIGVPVVVVGQDFRGVCSIYHDDFNATKELTNLILSKGRKNIAYIGVTERDISAGKNRHDGFCQAIKENNNAHMEYYIGDFSRKAGEEGAKALLEKNPDIDAFICATDTIALGVYKYIKDCKKIIPNDILVAGHGDSNFSDMVSPELTTVRYFFEESGVKAAKQLLSLMRRKDNDKSKLLEIKMGYEIVERNSTQCG
ncbi:LacI family DNA-binding transcriptional regulator [Lachnobacterium bovis]|uniref:LacI family transcriptional regulator, sucrose operon repressor n=1 Tax=Lachnobacterium bovis TaxID=140626 RepID=A0A1H9P999_9FIRM|nr:LacI family DNA-binding transcriptional regulator [Lachnobacterium bovis]SER44766.1 LacI family transcriptional regulator, sucrose operon repressor [Lachnobacterium bovis]